MHPPAHLSTQPSSAHSSIFQTHGCPIRVFVHPSTHPPNLSPQSILPSSYPPIPYSHPASPSPSEATLHVLSPAYLIHLPCWPRFPGGLVLFGICTLVMDVFKTGYYSSFFECQSAIKILHPIIQAVFVIVQVGRRNVPVWGEA